MSAELAPGSDATVPLGPGSIAVQTRRRWIFVALIVATTALMSAAMTAILSRDGLGVADALLIAVFVMSVPCPAIGMWNSLLGFALLRLARDPLAAVIPPAARTGNDDPITERTAVAMTMRNESPTRPFACLAVMRDDLDATPYGDRFDFFVLSDSTDADVIEAEEREAAAFRARFGEARLTYRRRIANVGYKGGNIHDFCERFGKNYAFLLPLDIDSLMSCAMILRLVRIMQKNPRLGILQSLATGLPTASLFARIFQFGHRHGMGCFVVGADWWQGDCCQFWGHNAAIRLAPFTVHCRLPVLSGEAPFGGHVICHDQVEAALMRRAGYEVRFLPDEGGSHEGNPPAAPDFVKRNSRWCRGNLQNLRLFNWPGLAAMSRFHLAYMAGKFFTAVAVIVFAILAAVAAATQPAGTVLPGAAVALYCAWFAIYLMPRLVGIADALTRAPARHGGVGRLLGGGIVEIAFTVLLTPISMFEAAYATVALMLGGNVGWDGQHRDGYRLSFTAALRAMWRPTAFGLVLLAFLIAAAPHAIVWFAPLLAGLVLAVPFTVATSWPRLGSWARQLGLCGVPEEFDPPPTVMKVLPLLLRQE